MGIEVTGSEGLAAEDIAIPPSDDVASIDTGADAAVGGEMRIIRRNGKVTGFDGAKIAVAMTKAFLAVEGGNAAASARVHDTIAELTRQVVEALQRRFPEGGGMVHIEDVQDQVELALMRNGEHKVARAYVLYREEQARKRAEEAAAKGEEPEEHLVNITLADGSTRPLDIARLRRLVSEACEGLEAVSVETILNDTCRNLFDGVKEEDVSKALVMSARTLIEQEPNYSYAAARLLMDGLRREALDFLDLDTTVATQAEMGKVYGDYFAAYIRRGIELELLDPRLGQYDLKRLGEAFKPERDLQFTYLGLQTLYDRYFIHSSDDIRFELPQAFFMRVAMGLAINEIDREGRTIEFYNLLSSFDFMSSTPTLFNSGTLRPQLSSCYLTTVPDDLDGIYSAIRDNAPAVQVRRRPGQRLDPGARAGLAHQGHQRQEPGRGALPQGGQRHRGGGQPRRQAQGCGMRLPRDLAHRYRGVPGSAQEHRRRPPSHPRHEHRQLDPRPVHAAGRRGR